MKHFLLLLFIAVLCTKIFSQDLITKRNGEQIKALVTEISENKVKYKSYDNSDSILYVINKQKVLKIKYEDGREDIFLGFYPRIDNPFGFNLTLGGPSLIMSVSTDYYITSYLNTEVGIGSVGYYAGMKYLFFGNKDHKNWTPYLGIYIASLHGLYVDEIYFNSYIPAGMQYIGKKGFSFGCEIAKMFNDGYDPSDFWGAIKLGYHLKSKSIKTIKK